MTTTQKKLIISLFMMTIIMALPMLAMADPEGGGELDTPIDGGLSLLVVAGVGYGAKKIKERKKLLFGRDVDAN